MLIGFDRASGIAAEIAIDHAGREPRLVEQNLRFQNLPSAMGGEEARRRIDRDGCSLLADLSPRREDRRDQKECRHG